VYPTRIKVIGVYQKKRDAETLKKENQRNPG
jgi:hypothetical protein